MAWDKTLPSTTTTIKNYPTVLTGNFIPLEEGSNADTDNNKLKFWSINLADRDNTAGPASDPTVIAGSEPCVIAYSKQDVDSKPQVYIKDIDDNIVQITDKGRLGGPTTTVSLNDFTFDIGTTLLDKNNIIDVYGSFSSNGVHIFVSGCTTVKNSTGLYTVTFTTPRTTTDYIVVATPLQNLSRTRMATIESKGVASFKIQTLQGGDQRVDESCNFMVLAGH